MNRRSFLTGIIAAPVVIRTAGLLMPISPVSVEWGPVTLGIEPPCVYYVNRIFKNGGLISAQWKRSIEGGPWMRDNVIYPVPVNFVGDEEMTIETTWERYPPPVAMAT